jgi:hypothetical protein
VWMAVIGLCGAAVLVMPARAVAVSVEGALKAMDSAKKTVKESEEQAEKTNATIPVPEAAAEEEAPEGADAAAEAPATPGLGVPGVAPEGTAELGKPAEPEKPAAEKKAPAPNEPFLVTDKGWRDPFMDPRERPDRVKDEGPGPDVGEDLKKIWDNAVDSIVLEGIMGPEDHLEATVGGIKIVPGDIVGADKLLFSVEKVTRSRIELRCINEEEEYQKLKGQKVKKELRI